MPSQSNNQKVIVGIIALIVSIFTALMWIFKAKARIKMPILIILTALSIGLWIWYASLPRFSDSTKSWGDLSNKTFQTITKGDLK